MRRAWRVGGQGGNGTRDQRQHRSRLAQTIAAEIKGVLANLVRHSDKEVKVGPVRPDHTAPREDKFAEMLKHIMQELQQLLNGTLQEFMQSGNEPGHTPHHPPPQGPHGHGLPPAFKEFAKAFVKLEVAEHKLFVAQSKEDRMETKLYGVLALM